MPIVLNTVSLLNIYRPSHYVKFSTKCPYICVIIIFYRTSHTRLHPLVFCCKRHLSAFEIYTLGIRSAICCFSLFIIVFQSCGILTKKLFCSTRDENNLFFKLFITPVHFDLL